MIMNGDVQSVCRSSRLTSSLVISTTFSVLGCDCIRYVIRQFTWPLMAITDTNATSQHARRFDGKIDISSQRSIKYGQLRIIVRPVRATRPMRHVGRHSHRRKHVIDYQTICTCRRCSVQLRRDPSLCYGARLSRWLGSYCWAIRRSNSSYVSPPRFSGRRISSLVSFETGTRVLICVLIEFRSLQA